MIQNNFRFAFDCKSKSIEFTGDGGGQVHRQDRLRAGNLARTRTATTEGKTRRNGRREKILYLQTQSRDYDQVKTFCSLCIYIGYYNNLW